MPSTYNLRSRSQYSKDEISAAKALVALRLSASTALDSSTPYNTRSVAQASRTAPKSTTAGVAFTSKTYAPSSTNSIASRVKKNPRFEAVDYADEEYLPGF